MADPSANGSNSATAVIKPRLKESFKKSRTFGPVFTGGAIAVSPDASTLYSTIEEDVVVLDVASGEQRRRISPNADTITALAIQPDTKSLIVATRALQLIALDPVTGTTQRSWKGHEAPVLVMDIESTSTLVATGSADSTVKVWDIAGAFCTHNFKGHSGVVSSIKFHKLTLVSGGEDGAIRVWDLHKRACVAVLKNHVSVVRGLTFLGDDGRTLVSAGRDKVICVWDVPSRKTTRVIPIYDALEAVQPAGQDRPNHVVCAGEKGQLHLVDTSKNADRPERSTPLASAGHSITHLLGASPEAGTVVAVTSDHNIAFLDTDNDFAKSKQLVGFNDEVIDVTFTGPDSKYLAVATNSNEIKLFNTETHDAELFTGHDGVVFCLAGSKDGHWLASGSKDKTARLWQVSIDDEGRPALHARASLVGHTESVGAIALSRKGGNFAVTGSQDRTIKLWDLKAVMSTVSDDAGEDAEPAAMVTVRAKFTVKAHDKDINSVAVAPNDRIFATASQDKSAKVWSTENGKLVGELRGHRRGLWRCAFSPVDQVLATSAGDKTIKLWNLKDFTCLRTFEGHTHSVLNVMFVSFGTQLLSSGSDGLVKLWTIKTNECVATLDAHEDRVWALASRGVDDGVVVSGGADSVIQVWEDSTVEEQEKRLKAEQDLIVKEQDLSNYLLKKDYKNAILLALSLNKPYRILKIVEEVMRHRQDATSISGSAAIDSALGSLPLPQVEKLLTFARDWNTHAKSSAVAHVVFRVLLEHHPLDALLTLAEIKPLADAVIAYTERHVNRLDEWVTQSYLLDYTIHAMDGMSIGGNGAPGWADLDADVDGDVGMADGRVEDEDGAVVKGGKRKRSD
ncbi:quinon protein alcohol dehydrogenase-like superfamily [Catenaria anguillulae PL171]|uniref:Quinon protein alcohol dehydrogenase-like superfamily n=1 Tax=Catenaria anguillulae PL171 TaxID=765915 RepID=A0A1Y2HZC9_9FUNG|nr:quinon protein alcohol dehydrogenase-like superfamily [Catenaria anguillulae PL171]